MVHLPVVVLRHCLYNWSKTDVVIGRTRSRGNQEVEYVTVTSTTPATNVVLEQMLNCIHFWTTNGI